MATRKPLVIISGLVQQLPSGDSLDAPVSSTDVIALTNGETSSVTIGTPVYISGASTGRRSQANSSNTAKIIGLVKDVSVAASAAAIVQTDGILSATSAQWNAIASGTTGLNPGSTYYLDPATAGKITINAPTSSGEYVLVVGTAISTTEIEISVDTRILL